MRTVHVFEIENASPRVTLCPDGETPIQAFVRIKSNIEHFGGTVTSVRTTTPIGESSDAAVEIRFFDRGDRWDPPVPMWHTVAVAPEDEWKAKP